MDLLTYRRAAEYLTVHPRTLRRYVDAGLIPVQRIGPGVVRINRADLDRYLAAQRRSKGRSRITTR